MAQGCILASLLTGGSGGASPPPAPAFWECWERVERETTPGETAEITPRKFCLTGGSDTLCPPPAPTNFVAEKVVAGDRMG